VSRKASIPEPFESLGSLRQTAMATKEGLEMLQGVRGTADDCAVTWGDLLRLGIVKKDQVPDNVRQVGTGR
jgi:hypothetical protein